MTYHLVYVLSAQCDDSAGPWVSFTMQTLLNIPSRLLPDIHPLPVISNETTCCFRHLHELPPGKRSFGAVC